MNARLHGYRCTGADAFGAGFPVGDALRRARGFRLARTLRDALADRASSAYGEGWPFRLFEVSTAPEDVLDNARLIRTRALRIERELPLTEALGPRAGEVVELVRDLRSFRWLRPGGAPSMEQRIAQLVGEHHQALADYEAVRPVPAHLVRTWQEARDVCGKTLPHEQLLSQSAAVRAVCHALFGTPLEGAFHLAQPAAIAAAYRGAWEDGWAAAGRSIATIPPSLPFLLPDDPHAAVLAGARVVEGLSVALAAAREPARAVAWRDVALDIFTNAPGEIPPLSVLFEPARTAARRAFAAFPAPRLPHGPGCALCASLPGQRDALVAKFIQHTAEVVVRLAMTAGRHAGWRVAYLLQNVAQRDPWRLLLDVWRLGGWPLGITDGVFVVYLPEPQS